MTKSNFKRGKCAYCKKEDVQPPQRKYCSKKCGHKASSVGWLKSKNGKAYIKRYTEGHPEYKALKKFHTNKSYDKKRVGSRARDLGYASMFEVDVARELEERGVNAVYEPESFGWTISGKYTPDFRLPSGVYVELKGYWRYEDRRRFLAAWQQNPKIDLRIVFQSKNKKNEQFCIKHGIKYAFYTIPKEW